jgi:hypothetical protein
MSETEKRDPVLSALDAATRQEGRKKEAPEYLLGGFLEFAIISTLMTVFFPWSLLFCLVFFGMERTKMFVAAMLHDFVKTLYVVVGVILSVLAVIFLIAVIAGSQ